MKDTSDATPLLRTLVEQLRKRVADHDDIEALRWIGFIRLALRSHQLRGGMSGWVECNDSRWVEVMQAKYDAAHHVEDLTWPGRLNMVWYKFNAWFGDGAEQRGVRMYRGVHTVASSAETYIGFDRAHMQLFVYHVVADEAQKV